MLPKGYLIATITRRNDFAADLATFWLRPAEPLDFEPGQYATLALEIDGKLVKRAYSIASAPHEAELEFYIECVEDGVLTPCLWDLKEGDELFIRRKIVGHFTLDEQRTQHAMAATVTGLAPFLSMVRHQAHQLEQGPLGVVHHILILHGSSHAAELGPYRTEVADLAAAHDWLDYVPSISRPWADPKWEGESGRVEEILRKWMDRAGFDPSQTAGYACGNPQMIENAKGILARARLAEDAIHEEKYFTLKDEKPEAEPVHVEQPKAARALPPGGVVPRAVKPKPAMTKAGRKPPPGALKLKSVKRPPSS